MEKGLLVYHPARVRKSRVFLPQVLRSMICNYFHDSMFGVHLGATKSLNRIFKEFFWPKMRSYVREYVTNCEFCPRAKPPSNTRVGLYSAETDSRPMQRLFMDFLRPLIRTRNGNKLILAMVDGFSKFVWLFPLRDMTSKSVVKILIHQVFAQHSIQECIITDNATVFNSKIFNDMCFQWGIRHVNTSPYYPQPNLVERLNRNLKSALIVFHHDHQLAWDKQLHTLQMGVNSTFHEATKSTPAELFLGRSLNHPLQLQWKLKLRWSP
ncbi:hypothetical protein ANN_00924 [Periplaneta americana]|uniref:RNA-directed DNA polymerase n=1 Tax=Periplaneta americana TaxID=6978 RepID=A0ABQ8TUK2_PERAM|nr:hypothetical protein ANN_00924 [Periplaneta americana]